MNSEANTDEVNATVAVCVAFLQDTNPAASHAEMVAGYSASFLGLSPAALVPIAAKQELALNTTGRWSHLMIAVETLRSACGDARLHELLQLLTEISLSDDRYDHLENRLIVGLAKLWDLHDSEDQSAHPWSVLETSSSTTADWGPVHDLAVLYIGIAHRTDNVLAREEVDAITKKLAEWLPDSLPVDVSHVIESAMSAYSRGNHDHILEHAMRSVGAAVPVHHRVAVLNDLMYIARADRVVLVEERNMIVRIAEAWGIDPSTIE